MNSKEILISIIIPTYNRKEAIIKLIDSLSNQKNKNFEIIVIDDGSTDGTYDILKKSISIKNFSIYRIKNSERGAARNFGATKSKGEYLNFFDSDDIALDNHISTAINKIIQFNYPEVINLSYAYKYKNNNLKKVMVKGAINNKIFSKNFISCNGVFIRKSIFNNYLFSENRDLSGSEDWHLWLRLSNKYNIHSFAEITSYIIDSDDRSMKTQPFPQVSKRIYTFLNFIKNDFKKEISYLNYCKINCELFSFLAMTASFKNDLKILSLKYLIISVLYNPFSLFTKRSLSLYYRIIFKW